MPINFIEELRWRGMIHNITPGTEEQLEKEMTVAYMGIDPTADSLHVGHLVGVMMLKHFQQAGHCPIVLIGGATGMIGDPSMKSQERNLLNEETLRKNQNGIRIQLAKLLDFDSNISNIAILVNNYDWIRDYSFLNFIRDIGKYITVNYMMSKDSVRKRLAADAKVGMSFTEFSYQLFQGYDYLFLYENYNCRLQMGGADQWGNITTGIELIRKKVGGKVFALTCPLITKTDGSKFGKTEAGNIWLDKRYTSPYKFYQFWLNVSDIDAEKYIRIFTVLSKKEIENLISKHKLAPHLRSLQRSLAKEVTIMVHSQEDYEMAVKTSTILFGNATSSFLKQLDKDTLENIFVGIPQFEIFKESLSLGIKAVDLLVDNIHIFSSRGEMRKLVQNGGVSINKEKLPIFDHLIDCSYLLRGRYILVQKGKKNCFLLKVKSS
ncbi:tyrosyl-tRNA synthetase [Candidatus Azobacteroides pseudotrichonymphae genomovar. CFP2]|uniref:Tyrosine--tRNA ligase n=1 Tax=Azobacteroides pseudotrichonymphae genomovar. CFP2 TaxID=511995 RepID=B6YR65_AZOPC|nr:tyrosyl-tRNA synthetase [Candidatus Azobacteroides pseudotrichonymphae genomovar. CFP2]